MKLKVLLIALLAIAGLYYVNRRLNERGREYIPGVPSTATPGSGEVRQEFTVGFLPVT